MPFLNGPGSRSIQIHIVQLYRTRDVPSVNRETRGVLFRWVRSLTASRVYEKESCHTPQPRPSLQNSTRLGYNEHAGWQLLYILRKEDEKMAEGFRAMMAYDGEASTIQAYLARPALEEPRPAVIVIHEIVGLTDHIKDVANNAVHGHYLVGQDIRPGLYAASNVTASPGKEGNPAKSTPSDVRRHPKGQIDPGPGQGHRLFERPRFCPVRADR